MIWLWILFGVIDGLFIIIFFMFMISAGYMNKEYDASSYKEEDNKNE